LAHVLDIESDVIALGRPEDSPLNTELIAVDKLARDDIFVFGNSDGEARVALGSQEQVIVHGIGDGFLLVVIDPIFCFFRNSDREDRSLDQIVIDVEVIGGFHYYLIAVNISDVGEALNLIRIG
jgi:hypothetical protein